MGGPWGGTQTQGCGRHPERTELSLGLMRGAARQTGALDGTDCVRDAERTGTLPGRNPWPEGQRGRRQASPPHLSRLRGLGRCSSTPPGPPLGTCRPRLLGLPLHGRACPGPAAPRPQHRAWGLGPPVGHRVRGKEPGLAWRRGGRGAQGPGPPELSGIVGPRVGGGVPRPPGGQEVPATSPGRLQPQPWGSSHAPPLPRLVQVPGKGLDPRFLDDQPPSGTPAPGPSVRPPACFPPRGADSGILP